MADFGQEINPLGGGGMQRRPAAAPRRGGLAGWMVKKGLATDENAATHTMIGIIIVAVALIFVIRAVAGRGGVEPLPGGQRVVAPDGTVLQYGPGDDPEG